MNSHKLFITPTIYKRFGVDPRDLSGCGIDLCSVLGGKPATKSYSKYEFLKCTAQFIKWPIAPYRIIFSGLLKKGHTDTIFCSPKNVVLKFASYPRDTSSSPGVYLSRGSRKP